MSGRGQEPPQVAVVVVAYRSADDLPGCLAALGRAVAGLRAEVVVVDNGPDHDLDGLSDAFPWVRWVHLEENAGFAGACHVGADVTSAPFLLLVNPDSQVEDDCVVELLACAQRWPQAAVVGGCALQPDGRVDERSWWGRPTLWSTVCFATGMSSLLPRRALSDPESSARWRRDERQVPIVSGALMLVRREAWDELGGFDRRFFVYGEDADLCLRAGAAGRPVVVAPRARTRHVGGRSSSSSAERLLLLYRGKVTLLERHVVPARLAVGLLRLGVGLRAAGSRIGVAASARRQGRPVVEATAWQHLHRRRREWAGGWPAAPA